MIQRIEELQNGAKDIYTSKSTSFWLSVWKTWCEGKSISLEIEEYQAHSQKCVDFDLLPLIRLNLQILW